MRSQRDHHRQNAGPTRYYGGRATLRFDLLDEAWLDRAVAWLASQDRHPYVLLLLDPERPDGPTVRPVPPRDARPKCVEPEVQPALN
jgi:hypothetical protein